ncbi:hypothetical protein [Xanthomonas fragariae]|uniref:hypothetical protein n=1 Tax=Xanthomonas fragariae TaxID=48664 RepID=UPI001ABDA379|nr:hypothetical protein [Xanthomonas fragariae]UKR52969.1 hypothetical protein K4A87_02550 [Xanthomonas fragariae]
MFHSIRSTQLVPAAMSLLAAQTAANDGDAATATVTQIAPTLDFRCGRTGTRNRDIWSDLPDIRSASDARRLQRWATSGVLFTAAAAVFAMALASFLLH